MIDRTAILESIHARLVGDPSLSDTLHIDDPTSLSALMSMAPDFGSTRNGDLWVESRCERLTGGRSIFAVIGRDEHGQLWVTAHSDPQVMHAQQRRITEEILGRPRGVRIRNMHAFELLHRNVTNQQGAVFHVSGLHLDAHSGRIVIDLLDLDEDDNPIPGTECGIDSLDGWEVH